MRASNVVTFLTLAIFLVSGFYSEHPYRFLTWKITYGDIYPLDVKQRGILINGQFPGPQIEAVTNDNLVIHVNYLRESFLISWNVLQHRRSSWEDGVSGTNCPIPPAKNMTYIMRTKDQIGTFYFPPLQMHKAAGAFGSIRIWSRPRIPVPFPPPSGDFAILTGDWFKRDHHVQPKTHLCIINYYSLLPFPCLKTHSLLIKVGLDVKFLRYSKFLKSPSISCFSFPFTQE